MASSISQALLGQIAHETDIMQRRLTYHKSNSTALRRFQAMFSVPRPIVAHIWEMTTDRLERTHLKHLLWAMMFLKIYASKATHAALAGVDEKMFRKWSWCWIDKISNLKIVLSHHDY